MTRSASIFTVVLVFVLVAIGCSGGAPVAPATGDDLALQTDNQGNSSQCVLWGYYEFHLDVEKGTLTSTPNRSVTWNANVVQFLNDNPGKMIFNMNDLDVGFDKVTVDIDVSIAHPFSGMPQFNGYDVRGIFCGNGSDSLAYNYDLDYAVYEQDQFMMDDPVNDDGGGPDGYTRWYNAPEFTGPGIFGYTDGIFASKNYTPDAILNPYKYFTDGLSAKEDLWEHLNLNPDENGIFSTGTTNTRNYYLEFPLPTPSATYGYSIVASWEDATTHPSNTIEAPAVEVEVTDDIYYINSGDWGGDLILDISIWSWEHQPDTIIIESTVLNTNLEIDTGSTFPTGNENYSTYHVEVLADNVTDSEGNEFWVICEYDGFDYTSDNTPPGTAPTDTLAAFFRYDLYVSPTKLNTPPVIDSGVDGNDNPHVLSTETYTVTAHDDDGDPLTWSWTVTDTSTMNEVISDDPGNSDGTIDIDWADVGAELDDEYDIDCEVSDGSDSEWAETLTVICGNILFQDDMENGEGDWLTFHSGSGAGWDIVSGGNDGHWWHSNAGNNYLTQPDCSRLYTPEITIPAGASNCHVEIFHTVRGYFWSNTISQGGMTMASYDDGSSFDTSHKPPVISGAQYTNEYYPYTATYFWALCNAGCGYGGPGSSLCWGWRVWANSTVTNAVSVMDYSYYIGDDIRIGFLYASYYYSGTYYWGIDDIIVTADP